MMLVFSYSMMHKDNMQDNASNMTFGQYLRCRTTVVRAMKISAIVGTILTAINQGDVILAGGWPPYWKLILTYIVPYSVSSYSTAALLFDQQKKLALTDSKSHA